MKPPSDIDIKLRDFLEAHLDTDEWEPSTMVEVGNRRYCSVSRVLEELGCEEDDIIVWVESQCSTGQMPENPIEHDYKFLALLAIFQEEHDVELELVGETEYSYCFVKILEKSEGEVL